MEKTQSFVSMSIPNHIIKSTLCIIMLGVFFIACKDEEFSHDNLLCYDGKYPDESARNIRLTYSDSGRLSFQITSPLINKYAGDSPFTDCPEGIQVISYDIAGQPESMLTAQYAISEEHTQRMEAQHNVIITNLKKGDTIRTEKIVWDQRNRRIYSDVNVRQTRADGTVYLGDGFDADEKFTKYTVRHPRGEIIADDL